jgi:hypothetical protein
MTIAELARLFNEHHGINAALEVVPMQGWSRDMCWDATDLPWVMPSPNMPTLDTAIVYPGTVLYEGTMLSEGRGTTRPFELIGAPWLDGEDFASRLNATGAYRPTSPGKFRADLPEARARTAAVAAVTDRRLRAGQAGVALMRECYGLAPTGSTGARRLTNTAG